MEKGYLYSALGQSYVSEAISSANSLKAINPEAHITLFSDRNVDAKCFDRVVVSEVSSSPDVNEFGYLKDGFTFKIQALLNAPYERTFFIDTDTHFLDPCTECFDLLDFYDLLISTDTSDHTPILHEGRVVPGYFAYNTGVILFRKSLKVIKFYEDWLQTWQDRREKYPQDQPAFMEALLSNNLKVYTLPVNYNFRLQFFVSVKGKVRILHGRHGNYRAAAQKVNAVLGQRMWDYQLQGLVHNMKARNFRGRLISLLPKRLYCLYTFLKRNTLGIPGIKKQKL